MEVCNVHSRIINEPQETVAKLFRTLATKEDQIWPAEKWPAMRFKNGLQMGGKGGHGPIRYQVEVFAPGKMVKFRFLKPTAFHGTHQLEINQVDVGSTEIKHTISMRTKGFGTLIWVLAIRWLHDALLEDALDKIENRFSEEQRHTPWSQWVKLLRWFLK